MLNLPTIAELQVAVGATTDPALKRLLADRLADTINCGLQELTHVLVVEVGDSEQAIVDAVGFSPLVSRIDGVRNSPDWDWIERHDGWWELLYTVGNDGFAYILLVEDAERSPLAKFCRSEGPSR
ncbi:hypothetical protein [Hyphomonas atlantica]|uniref:hypothetical protein n=1 Tax=Hyphomonas atlantica TaxID=1280948 RepID=UPI000C55EFE9|nr:hypothetical protein [Sphingomonadaceae bacterium]|tara:strand:+ start:2586 stop:2960 length:375 start_codon:yes stop_codon:yes gene_type:complete